MTPYFYWQTVHPILGFLTVLTVYMKIGFKMCVPASFVNISGKYEKQKLKKNGKIFVYLIIFKVGFELFFSLRMAGLTSGNTICIRKRPFQKWLLKSTNLDLALSRQKALSNATLIKHVTVKEISTIIPIMLDAPSLLRKLRFYRS